MSWFLPHGLLPIASCLRLENALPERIESVILYGGRERTLDPGQRNDFTT